MGLLLPLYILIFIGLIYVFGVRPQKKRRQELERIMGSLEPGAEIVMVSGIYGTVTEVEDGDTLLVEIAEDVDIRIAKAAVQRVISGTDAVEAPAADDVPAS
ncbi:MAG: preprotein translocase subunit YajC [Thermoleophilia bacterium]